MLLQLTKVTAAERLVWGRIDETPDRTGEIFDYASSKPHIEKWSNDLEKASGGKSLGNIRVMHQLKAAGVLKGIEFDDARKSVEVCGHIVDDDEWAKVEAGVYTGFSPGGRKRFLDGTKTRYTAFPAEISLVDLPCIPSATFTMVKADGGEERRGFAEPVPDGTLWKALAGARSRRAYRGIVLGLPAAALGGLFGDAPELPDGLLVKRDYSREERRKAASEGAALPDGSYPIYARKDVEDAVEDWARTGARADVKAHIIHRAKAIDATDALPADWEGSTRDCADCADTAGLAKLAGERAAALEDLAKVTAERDLLKARLAELQRRPAAGGPRLLAVERGERPSAELEPFEKIERLPAETPAQQLAKATLLTRVALNSPRTIAAKGNGQS